MLAQRKKWGYEKGLGLIFIEDLFTRISSYFIDKERNRWIIENKFQIEKLEIEKVSEKELEDILLLQKLAFQSEAIKFDDFDIRPLTMTLKDTLEEFDEKIFFKAVIDNKIVGSIRAYVEAEVCYIEKLIVHPDFQNLGVGKKLILFTERYFSTCKRYEIFTRKGSEKNIRIYEKLGYQKYKEARHLESYEMVYLEKYN